MIAMKMHFDEKEVQLLQMMVADSSNVTHMNRDVKAGLQQLASRISDAISRQCPELERKDLESNEF